MRSRLSSALGALVVVSVFIGAAPRLDGFVPSRAAAETLAPLPVRPGPVPDYAPLDSVWTHPQLMTLAPDFARRLTRYLGERHRIETYVPPDPDLEASAESDPDVAVEGAESDEDDSLVWMRDYQPIYVRRADGGIEVVRYLHANPNRSAYLPLWHPTADPFPPSHGDGKIDVAPALRTLPLLHENGNLVVAGRWLLMTDLIIEDNALPDDLPHLVAAGFIAREPSEVITGLARTFGRDPGDIVILPRMPEEQTGHVDLFVMALSDTLVMVPEIRAESLGTGDVAVEVELAEEVRLFLDEVAARLKRLGLEVIRLPMVPPLTLPSVEPDDPPDPVFYSPANGLLLRTADKARVLLPSADLREVAPGLARLQRRYERHWSRVLRSRGWTPTRVDASELARYLGLFRCVTQVVPAR